jgi:hypothetical protein
VSSEKYHHAVELILHDQAPAPADLAGLWEALEACPLWWRHMTPADRAEVLRYLEDYKCSTME